LPLRASQIGLFVSKADGTDERLLLRSDSLDYNPAWSPDGKWIAFSGETLIERFGAYRESERMCLLETKKSAR
jgi:Tol biopolymer transport system component